MTTDPDCRCPDCAEIGCECPHGYAVTHCECPTCGYRFAWVEARCNNEPRLCPRCVGEVRAAQGRSDGEDAND